MGGRGSAGRASNRSGDGAQNNAASPPPPPSPPTVLPYRMSDAPLALNSYDDHAQGDPSIDYHEDGEIGTALQMMGQDRRLDVDGQPLYNVLGRIATRGRREPQAALDELKALHARLPEGSTARYQVGRALDKLDAPDTPPPPLPDGTPEPLRRLATDLWAIPAVRRSDPGMEGERLTRLVEDWKAGRLPAFRLTTAIRDLDARHESAMGWDQIRTIQGRALNDISELIRTQGRHALDPPA